MEHTILRIPLPSVVRAFRARDIKPDYTHKVAQGQLNLWLFANTFVGELVMGENDTTPGAILMTSDCAYINTAAPQEIADDIYRWNQGNDAVSQLRSSAAAALGSITSDAKAAASRENGKRGGRPRKKTE